MPDIPEPDSTRTIVDRIQFCRIKPISDNPSINLVMKGNKSYFDIKPPFVCERIDQSIFRNYENSFFELHILEFTDDDKRKLDILKTSEYQRYLDRISTRASDCNFFLVDVMTNVIDPILSEQKLDQPLVGTVTAGLAESFMSFWRIRNRIKRIEIFLSRMYKMRSNKTERISSKSYLELTIGQMEETRTELQHLIDSGMLYEMMETAWINYSLKGTLSPLQTLTVNLKDLGSKGSKLRFRS